MLIKLYWSGNFSTDTFIDSFEENVNEKKYEYEES